MDKGDIPLEGNITMNREGHYHLTHVFGELLETKTKELTPRLVEQKIVQVWKYLSLISVPETSTNDTLDQDLCMNSLPHRRNLVDSISFVPYHGIVYGPYGLIQQSLL